MSYHYYTIAKLVAEELRESSQQYWSDRICDAIDSGSTGTEIVMTLRSILEQVLKDNNALPSTAIENIKHLQRELAKIIE